MRVEIDEEEQDHLYGCLLAGNNEWNGIRKKLAKMNREDDSVEAALQMNAKLRKMFNPRAEEDAREKSSRLGQTDIEDEIEGATETGGSTKQRVTTPAAQTDEQIRDALINIGLTMPIVTICGLEPDARREVETWIGQVVAANTIGGSVPEEPTVIRAFSLPNEVVQERLELGPYTVIALTDDDGSAYEVVHVDTKDVKETLVDPIDAGFFAAQLNIERLRNSEMSDEDVSKWADAGPWTVVCEDDDYMVQAGSQTEFCSSIDDAFGRAARYNRSIKERADAAAWQDQPPVAVSDDAVQEIKAAAEHETEPVAAE